MPDILRTELKKYRERHDLSLRELASQLDLSVRTVHQIDSGQSLPQLAVLRKLAKHLKLKPTQIGAYVLRGHFRLHGTPRGTHRGSSNARGFTRTARN